MRVTSLSVVLLLLSINEFCFGSTEEALEVAPGIFSIKAECDGLSLPATSTFIPIHNLMTTIHISKASAVFVHYQITMWTNLTDFQSKLLINYANAGSLVHSGKQIFKTATGFYMDNLNPGAYTFMVQYKSPVAINVPANYDWQTAILQIVWAQDAQVASDSIKCFPSAATTTNTYNIWGPIKDVEAVLYLPSNRAILSAYDFSTEMSSSSHVVTALDVDGFHQHTASFIKGNTQFLDLHGAWAGNARRGVHYFNIQYRTPTSLSFADCKQNFENNKNLYAMMLPSSCSAVTVSPESTITLSNSNKWAPTDVTSSFKLTKQSFVIIFYQYAGFDGNTYVVMRLSIDSVPQKHTVSLTGNTVYTGNFGLWQGQLNSGTHKITLDYRTPTKTTNYVPSNLDWPQVYGYGIWMNRALTVITC